MKRKAILGSFLSSAAALSLPPVARAANDFVRVGVLPIDSSMECNYAAQIGLAADAHLNLGIQYITSGSAVMSAIIGRSIDTGVVNMFSILTAHDKGLPVIILAGSALYSSKFATAKLVVSRDSSIHSAKDLNGKTVAVDGLRSISQITAMAWIDKNGGDSKTVNYVEMPIPDMQLALATKRIDAGSMPEPFASRAAEADGRILCNVYDGIGPSWLQNAWTVSADWARSNPDVAKRLRAMIYRTAAWANAHHDETAKILSQASKVSIDVIDSTPRVPYAVEDEPQLIDPVIDAAVKYGVIARRPNAQHLFALS